MIRVWTVFILLVALIVWGVLFLMKHRKPKSSPITRFAAKVSPGEIWTQLYETGSSDEIVVLRKQLVDEKIEHLIYEQGKRDSYGNIPKKYGIVVSRGHLSRGQSILTRILS